MSINRLFFIFLLSFFSISIFAQIDSSEVDDSPYSVIYNHLYYLQHDSYEPEKAALSFPDIGLDNEQVASLLKGYLDGKGYYIDINRIPSSPDYIDSTSSESIYYLNKAEPLVYVEKKGGSWSYSITTTKQSSCIRGAAISTVTFLGHSGSIAFWGLRYFSISDSYLYWYVLGSFIAFSNSLARSYLPVY